MDGYKTYTELDAWKQARELVKCIYELTDSYHKNEQYGLTSQMRRCSVSVPSNIAEGGGRHHSKDTMNFLYMARGSLYELETQLYLSLDLSYIDELELSDFLGKITRCKQLLNGLINYYNTLVK